MNSKLTAGASSNTASGPSLYEVLGGKPAIDALVGALYFHILNDTRIAHFFSNTDIDALRRYQELFLTSALGGDITCYGPALSPAHQRLVEAHSLNDGQFDAVLECAKRALRDFGYDDALVVSVAERLESTRNDVLGR